MEQFSQSYGKLATFNWSKLNYFYLDSEQARGDKKFRPIENKSLLKTLTC